MKSNIRLIFNLGILLLGAAGSYTAHAASISVVNLGTVSNSATNTGTLANQAQVVEETFTLASTSNIVAFTTSYGGGTNLNGTTTSPGGFQPSLILFNSSGNYVAGETYPSPIAHTDPTTHWALDAYLSDSNLPAGTYIIALTDWLNQQSPSATNLSDGFTFDLGSGGSTFVDAQGNMRTANYAFNLSVSPSAAAVPEPASFWLVIPAMSLMFCVFKRRSRLNCFK
jgi:hypothetical protein